MNVEQWLLETGACDRFLECSDGYDGAILRCYTSSAPSLDSLSIATFDSMPSPIAPAKSRPITRLSKYKFNDGEIAPNKLSSEQLDIWEHAGLLYHAFEWEAAADTFVLLSQTLRNIEARMLCLLNAGIIRARLGDYSMANSILREAAHIDDNFLLTPFLLGLVSFELGDYGNAEACFDLLLDELESGAIDHSDVGLNFIVDHELLRRNLQAAQTAHYLANFPNSSTIATSHLDAVPADYIFEAPPRIKSLGPISEQEYSPRNSSSPFTRFTSKRLPRLSSRPYPPTAGRSSRSASSPQSGYMEPLSIVSENPPGAVGPENPSSGQAPLSSSALSSGTSQRLTWHRRPSTPYTPRDARAEYGSTRELARFIRKADGDKPNLIPRDAKGEYESVGELANFVQLYAPEKGHAGALPPLVLDPHFIADLRLQRTLNGNYDAAAGSPISEESLSVESPGSPSQFVGTTESLRRPSFVPDSIYSEGSEDEQSRRSMPFESEISSEMPLSPPLPQPRTLGTKEITLECLQPTTYQPGIATDPVNDHDTVSSTQTNSHIIEMYANAAASPSNSLYNGLPSFERRTKARKDALKALTGKSSSTLTSDGSSARRKSQAETTRPEVDDGDGKSSMEIMGSPVESVKFFEKVLGRGKKGR